MNTVEERMREAFDTITMPENLREDTIDAIERLREGDIHVDRTPAVSKRTRKPVLRRWGYALAACLLLGALGFGGFTVYAMETATVGIEMNPSIELGINRFDTVVAARALDEDGATVLKQVSVVGKSSDEALALITASESFLSFITDDSFVDIYVICDDVRQSESLLQKGASCINTVPCKGSSNAVSAQEKTEAARLGMGIAQYGAAQELLSLDPSYTLEGCCNMSMREIRACITELDPTNPYALGQGGKGTENGGSGNGQGDGNGQGRGNGQGNGNGKGHGRRG